MYYHDLDFFSQGRIFLFAVLFGVCAGVVYAVMHGIFYYKKISSALKNITDILFFIIFSFSFFTFDLVVYNGKSRVFEFIGIIGGFLLFYLTLGKTVKKKLNTFISALIRPFEKLAEFLKAIVKKYYIKLSSCIKKILQKIRELLYNYNVKSKGMLKFLKKSGEKSGKGKEEK